MLLPPLLAANTQPPLCWLSDASTRESNRDSEMRRVCLLHYINGNAGVSEGECCI